MKLICFFIGHKWKILLADTWMVYCERCEKSISGDY